MRQTIQKAQNKLLSQNFKKEEKAKVKPDFKAMRLVRVDHKTEIYVPVGKDPAKAVAKFLQKINEPHRLKFQMQ